jgi:outer membrane protein W
MVTGDYYLNNNNFRPFVGLGLGIMGSAAMTVDTDENQNLTDVNIGAKNNFGALVRAGFDYKHFRTTLSYNYGGKVAGYTHHFIGLSVGFYIGGGRK